MKKILTTLLLLISGSTALAAPIDPPNANVNANFNKVTVATEVSTQKITSPFLLGTSTYLYALKNAMFFEDAVFLKQLQVYQGIIGRISSNSWAGWFVNQVNKYQVLLAGPTYALDLKGPIQGNNNDCDDPTTVAVETNAACTVSVFDDQGLYLGNKSNSDGFKIAPDGKVWKSGVAVNNITQKTSVYVKQMPAVTIPSNTRKDVELPCDSVDLAISGGYEEFTLTGGLDVVASRPSTVVTKWILKIYNRTAGNKTFDPYVMCMRVPQ